MRTVQRTVPLARELIFAKSAGLSQNTLSSSTEADATPSALKASMQKMAHVNAVAPLAKHVKEMPPIATLVKKALSWTRQCAGKPALRGTWLWRGYASIAQRCVRSASTRKRAKSACLSPFCTRICAIGLVPTASMRMHATVFPAMKTVCSAMAPQQTTVTSVLSHPWFSMMGNVWTSVQQELTMKPRLKIAKIATSPARPAHHPGPARPVRKA